MGTRADHFVAQADSDLRHAQAMARSDQSGQALGTSMYLCQQSVEKAFKSVLLRLDERLGLEMGDCGISSLGHSLYPGLYELYMTNVSPIRLPRLPPKYERQTGTIDAAQRAADRELQCFESLSSSWRDRRARGRLRLLAWRHSVGIHLDRNCLLELNSFHMPSLRRLYASVFGDAQAPMPIANEDRPTALCTRIMEGGLSKADYDSYVSGRNYAPMHSTLHGTYEMASGFFDTKAAAIPDVNRVPRSEIARRAVLEFGFRALALAALPYRILHPHGTMGRYPERLDDGRFTDDVYGAQAEYVIKTLFLEGKYLVWGLCATSMHVDKLWGMGRREGLW